MMLAALASVAAAVVASPAAPFPHWATTTPNASLPFGGLRRLPHVTFSEVYHASPETGLYNHVPMLDVYAAGSGVTFLTYWVNAPVTEGDPTRVLYSQSVDGSHWSPVNDSTVLFPPFTLADTPRVILYAGPALHINGHVYVAASQEQTELYPVEWPFDMLLRSVDTGALHSFGPLFWASDAVPKGMEEQTAQYGILTLGETDAATQADIRGSGLANAAAPLPCGPVGGVASSKCEACAGGCLPQRAFKEFLLNEHTHFTVPPSDARSGFPQVELLRSQWCSNATRNAASHLLWATTRASPSAAWTVPQLTDIPDSCSNINAGALPDGRRFLLSNAGPYGLRDPLTLALTRDGYAFDEVYAVVSCAQLSGCADRGGNGGGPGVAYPQGVVVTAPPFAAGLWVTVSNNKEDVFVLHVPLGAW